MFIAEGVEYVGVNDHEVDLFEGQYAVKNGMAYNSYVIKDEKIAVMDTVDANFTEEWLNNLKKALGGKSPDYLIVQHMEPDHSANIANFMSAYPDATIVSSAKAFAMMEQFFKTQYENRRIVAGDGDTLCLGSRTLTFVSAPMVHWPEVIVTYDDKDEILFSADGFGKFGALDRKEEWTDEARRYYIGIVGKYGMQVQNLLKKASGLKISKICPLHGPVLSEDLGKYLGLYDRWSSYTPEEKGVVIAYASVYGNTKRAAESLAAELKEKGVENVALFDLARCDMSEAVAYAFRYSAVVFASLTYNGDVFPFMRTFIESLTERYFRKRTVGFIENGS
ncbi:MAG TPA: flavodoxin, partial [Clostridiales bacterium]|nr:flavodoxin [Clostridiales bacterium]